MERSSSCCCEQVAVPTTWLSDLPLEVLGIICRLLSLEDRVSLSSTCRALLYRLASCEDAWGTLQFINTRSCEKLPSVLAWLARRRQGLRRLELNFFFAPKSESSQAAAQLAACLEGSPLVQLKLSNVRLPSEESGTELQWLGSCTALTSLMLRDCGLSCLPGALKLLPALAELSLPGSRSLGRAGWAPLRQLTALTRLDVSCCGLTTLPAELSALPALAMLELQGNVELGAAAEEAWSPLAQCSALTSLDLWNLPFLRLPLALTALAPHLVDLDLKAANQGSLLSGGQDTLGPLFRLTGLTRLKLRMFLGDSPLPEELSCLRALQDLDLSHNYPLGQRPSLLPLRHLTALTRLNLNACDLKNLPEELSHLQAQKNLQFRNNPLELQEVSWQHLCKLTALTRLNLENCNLQQLPPELTELRSLADLNLRCNTLLGALRDEGAVAAKWAALEQLTALTRLNAAYCELDVVPAVFAALCGLRVLRLGGNRSLGRGGVEALRPLVMMTSLQRLDLFRCSLPRELEVDAIPFPLHRLEGWAERVKDLPEEEVQELRLE